MLVSTADMERDLHEAGIHITETSDERDAYHQAVALANAAGWINKIAIDEYVERIRAARRGPVAVPPNDNDGDAA